MNQIDVLRNRVKQRRDLGCEWMGVDMTFKEAQAVVREYDELQARCDLRMPSLKENVAPISAEREIRERASTPYNTKPGEPGYRP